MPLNKTQERKLQEVIRLLNTGPSSLNERSSFTPGGDEGEKAREYLMHQYSLWANSWILPVLESLIKKP